MGLFSKLLGKKAEDMVESMFGDEKHFFDNLRPDDKPQPADPPRPPKPAKGEQPRGDLPWGELMPKEENQYSFDGTYIEYFDMLFREEFAQYQIGHETDTERYHEATIFTFTSGGRKALVVELMSEKSSSRKLALECQREGTPYLRFYYDHHGWWNARSYVVDRVRGALSV